MPSPICRTALRPGISTRSRRIWNGARSKSGTPSACRRHRVNEAEVVERVAREFVARDRHEALDVLGERAKAADLSGDELSARAWWDIADAAERILRSDEYGASDQ